MPNGILRSSGTNITWFQCPCPYDSRTRPRSRSTPLSIPGAHANPIQHSYPPSSSFTPPTRPHFSSSYHQVCPPTWPSRVSTPRSCSLCTPDSDSTQGTPRWGSDQAGNAAVRTFAPRSSGRTTGAGAGRADAGRPCTRTFSVWRRELMIACDASAKRCVGEVARGWVCAIGR